jgi:hypothetical protein
MSRPDVRRAAAAVVDEWDAYRADMFLSARIEALRTALRGEVAAQPTGTPVWDIDPHTQFCRVGGKLVARVTERPDGTWEVDTGDQRRWPLYRSSEAARRAFEDHWRQSQLQNRAGAVVTPVALTGVAS